MLSGTVHACKVLKFKVCPNQKRDYVYSACTQSHIAAISLFLVVIILWAAIYCDLILFDVAEVSPHNLTNICVGFVSILWGVKILFLFVDFWYGCTKYGQANRLAQSKILVWWTPSLLQKQMRHQFQKVRFRNRAGGIFGKQDQSQKSFRERKEWRGNAKVNVCNVNMYYAELSLRKRVPRWARTAPTPPWTRSCLLLQIVQQHLIWQPFSQPGRSYYR